MEEQPQGLTQEQLQEQLNREQDKYVIEHLGTKIVNLEIENARLQHIIQQLVSDQQGQGEQNGEG